jgi:hypothetical protein
MWTVRLRQIQDSRNIKHFFQVWLSPENLALNCLNTILCLFSYSRHFFSSQLDVRLYLLVAWRTYTLTWLSSAKKGRGMVPTPLSTPVSIISSYQSTRLRKYCERNCLQQRRKKVFIWTERSDADVICVAATKEKGFHLNWNKWFWRDLCVQRQWTSNIYLKEKWFNI